MTEHTPIFTVRASDGAQLSKLTSRSEFRAILKGIVNHLKMSLDRPNVPPLTPEEIHFWLREITTDDIQAVVAEISTELNNGGTAG